MLPLTVRKRSKLRNRRGISAVVTSVLLVSAVSMMGMFLVSWSNASFALQRLNVAEETSDRINQVKESFVLEDVWFFSNITGKYANVTVRNTGDLAVTIDSIYVNNTIVASTSEVIAIGNVATIDIPVSWGQGKPQDVWVQTERGTEAKQVWKS